MSIRQDLSGFKFGKLTVIEYSGVKRKSSAWLCRCECGNEKILIAGDLKKGHTNSCGCSKSELISKSRTTHGMTISPEYDAYKSMKERCYKKDSHAYNNYGERGITVCDRWLSGFEFF